MIEQTAVQCAGEYYGDKWPELEICVEGTEGDEYFETMGQLTHAELAEEGVDEGNPWKGDIPLVKVDGKRNEAARTNLMKAVCDEMEVIKHTISYSIKQKVITLN